MKIEDLKNTKIYLSNEEDRVKFQKKVFKLGIEWWWDDDSPQRLIKEHPFYYIDGNLKLNFDSLRQKHFFLEYEYKQIFLEDVLSIEEPKEEYKFKPFDKVLVRDNAKAQWLPAWYSFFDNKHLTSAGFSYKYCIPYEGNEHLVGTTKNKDE